MTQLVAPRHERTPVGVVWEGEWPAVKELVRTGRGFAWCVSRFLHDALAFPGAGAAVSGGIAKIDGGVHRGSLVVASAMGNAAPWMSSAAAVVLGSVAVTVKSNHFWGPVAAARNGLVTLTAASLFFFPGEIRSVVFGGDDESTK